MQHRVDGACELLGDLPNKNIDTGSSVERVAMVLQDKASFFETDLFAPLLEEVQSLSGKHYGADEKHDVAIRIVGEHARATAFLVADGVQPSNEGRGYILRRMLRRVVSRVAPVGRAARGVPPARGAWSSTGSATPIRSSGRTGRSSRRCSPPRRTASRRRCAKGMVAVRRGARPRRRREPSRAPTRSSCPTRSGSRSS